MTNLSAPGSRLDWIAVYSDRLATPLPGGVSEMRPPGDFWTNPITTARSESAPEMELTR